VSIGPETQAVLLLTCRFGKEAEAKPLGPAEWSRLTERLKSRNASVGALLTAEHQLLGGWVDRSVTRERVAALLDRAGALGLLLEKWQRAGLWVMSSTDADYPARLTRRLEKTAPPALFGCGPRHLLNLGGVAVVGSRDASESELAWTKRVAQSLASQKRSVISGGARGVDETAMLGALEAGGTAVGVLPDGLLKAITSAKYRGSLLNQKLVLLSPYNPESAFDAGQAIGRNKHIYCLADTAVVAASRKEKGGTWTGALDNLKHGWVPLLLNRDAAEGSGNQALVEHGGQWMPEDFSLIGQTS
jgi:predicted Rossmann fold nucleotide-binding protein DprA/Smf involved in DNA uptake